MLIEPFARFASERSANAPLIPFVSDTTGKVLDAAIEPEVVDPEDVELLEDLVCAALRDALAKTAELKREKVLSATPLGAMGVELPDIF